MLKAEDVISNGDLTLFDINGREIEKQEIDKYYLVVDGQHRTYAVALYNDWAINQGNNIIDIPATIIELKENETVADYINEINISKKQWTTPDYVRGAFNVKPEDEFLKCFNSLLRTEKNKDGYPLSTLCLIFCGRKDAIKTSDFSLLCAGKEVKGKGGKDIIPPHNIECGNKFIELCRDKGFDEKSIGKRYLAEQFNEMNDTYKDVDKAFEVFNSINENDRKAMFNDQGHLDEALVIAQFKLIKERN